MLMMRFMLLRESRHSGISLLLLLSALLALIIVSLAGGMTGEATSSEEDTSPSEAISSFCWSLNVLYLNFVEARI
jgi:hypothetical protein